MVSSSAQTQMKPEQPGQFISYCASFPPLFTCQANKRGPATIWIASEFYFEGIVEGLLLIASSAIRPPDRARSDFRSLRNTEYFPETGNVACYVKSQRISWCAFWSFSKLGGFISLATLVTFWSPLRASYSTIRSGLCRHKLISSSPGRRNVTPLRCRQIDSRNRFILKKCTCAIFIQYYYDFSYEIQRKISKIFC